MLTAIVLLPLLVALAAYFLPAALARRLAVVTALADFALVLFAWQNQAPVESYRWIPTLGIDWRLSFDGVSGLMAGLAAMLTLCALGALSARVDRQNELSALMLLLLSFLQGVFLADNLGVFYIFWELMIIPAFLMVGRWGDRRAAFKFFLYTLVGSLAMLLGLLLIAFGPIQVPDLNFSSLAAHPFPPHVEVPLMMLFLLGFAVKIPLFPLHGWQVDTYESAPAPVVAVIAGAMSKAGLYGLLRIAGFFTTAFSAVMPGLMTVALLSLLYGCFAALGQTRTRRVLAYSSLAHVAMMTLGVFCLQPTALEGAGLQMLAHGVTTGGLFLLLGYLEDRDLPQEMGELGGLAGPMPIFGLALLLFSMAALGLPALGSFPGELLILTGLFSIAPAAAILASLSLVAAAWFLLRFFQRIANGSNPNLPNLLDLDWREQAALVPLAVMVVWLGLRPYDWQVQIHQALAHWGLG